MTSGLEQWLNWATRGLSRESAARIRSEIREHYQASLETGLSEDRALAALGDAAVANREYRKVMLTSAEARILREGNWEARVVCARGLAKGVTAAAAVIASAAMEALIRSGGRSEVAKILLIGSIGIGLMAFLPTLPVYTRERGRIVRYVRWMIIVGLLIATFGGETLKYSWLLMATMWSVGWVEWTRKSIRRKLPIGQWPKHLYL